LEGRDRFDLGAPAREPGLRRHVVDRERAADHSAAKPMAVKAKPAAVERAVDDEGVTSCDGAINSYAR